MKAIAATAGLTAMVMSLSLPALLLAQEPPVEPAPVEPVPTEPAPEVPPPPADGGVVGGGEEATASEQTSTPVAPVLAKGAASVNMVDYAFSPATVTINVGDTVSWTNTGEEDHDAAGSGFSTGTVTPGSSGSATFSSGGTFAYVCSFHPDMKGTVVVNDTSSGGTGGDKDGDGTVDPTTGAPLGTEAAATTSADAAGTANGLPATGETEAPLLILGIGLFACGGLAATLARWRSRESNLPLRLG